MSVWSRFTSWLSGWPESKEERQTYAEERREQKREEIKKKKIRKQGNLK